MYRLYIIQMHQIRRCVTRSDTPLSHPPFAALNSRSITRCNSYLLSFAHTVPVPYFSHIDYTYSHDQHIDANLSILYNAHHVGEKSIHPRIFLSRFDFTRPHIPTKNVPSFTNFTDRISSTGSPFRTACTFSTPSPSCPITSNDQEGFKRYFESIFRQ